MSDTAPDAEAAMIAAALGEGHDYTIDRHGYGMWTIHDGYRSAVMYPSQHLALVTLVRRDAAAQATIAELRAALAWCQHQRGLTGDAAETPDPDQPTTQGA